MGVRARDRIALGRALRASGPEIDHDFAGLRGVGIGCSNEQRERERGRGGAIYMLVEKEKSAPGVLGA